MTRLRLTSYHLRGREVCENRQFLPMDLTNRSVLETLRAQLLDRRVMERALSKLERRLSGLPGELLEEQAHLYRRAVPSVGGLEEAWRAGS